MTLFAWVSDDTDSAKLTDSDSVTLFAWVSDIESVSDTDSVRFTGAVFEIESVKQYRYLIGSHQLEELQMAEIRSLSTIQILIRFTVSPIGCL